MTYWINLKSPKSDLEKETIKHYDASDSGHTRGSIEYLWDLISCFGDEEPSEKIAEEYDIVCNEGYEEFAVID